MRRLSLGLSALLVTSCVVAGMVACGSDGDGSTFGDGTKDSGVGSNGDASGLTNGDGSVCLLCGGDAGESVQKLVFSPGAATVLVDGTSTKSATYTLTATFADGSSSAVTPDSIEFDRPDLGAVVNGNPVTATAPSPAGVLGGTGTLHAIFHGVEATATLTVQASVVAYGAGLSATSASVVALGGGSLANGGTLPGGGLADGGSGLPTDPTANIAPLLYPYDQTMFPLGITAPPIMWNAPAAGDVYRLHFAEKNFVYDDYTTLAALPGQLRIAQATWDTLTASNDAKDGADPITFTLSRWDHSSQKAYTSATAAWNVAPASLAGAIYYWTTSNGGALSRIPPGAGAKPVALTGPMGINCMGCHAVSADGSTLIAALKGGNIVDGPDDSRAWTSFDLTNPSVTDAGGGAGATVRKQSNVPAGNVAVSPDGKYVLSGDKTLQLSDSTTADIITDTSKIPLSSSTYTGFKTPAFAPDGTSVAAVESGGDWQYWDYTLANPSELVLLSFDPGSKTFGTTATKLIDSSYSGFTSTQHMINYPSFSPDSKFVAYQVGDHQSGCFGGAAANNCSPTTTQIGAIYLQSVSGGNPVRLTNLSDPPLTSDRNLAFEPTFNPTARGGYFWLVFTSERSWGNMSDVQGTPDNDKKRLWVSAIDAVTGAADPSHPAFFLEGQATTTQNMRGFWTVSSCIATPNASVPSLTDGGASTSDAGAGGACVNGFDCCSGFCEQGVCVDPSALTCAGIGSACTTTSECCNAGSASCISGACATQGIR